MLHPLSPRALALCSLALGLVAAAQPSPPGGERTLRQRVLSVDAATGPLEVLLAPGYTTSLTFNAALAPGGVALEGGKVRFALVDLGAPTLVLQPVVALAPGERLALTVRFADGLAPPRAAFVLVGHPSEVDGQVRVVRQFPVTTPQTESRPCEVGGLAGPILSGAVGKKGVTVTSLRQQPQWEGLEQGHDPPRLYRSDRRVTMALPVRNPEDLPPWVPGEARLTWLGADGEPVGAPLVLPVHLATGELAPGAPGEVVVEWEVPSGQTPEVVSLSITDQGGRRGVHWQRLEL